MILVVLKIINEHFKSVLNASVFIFVLSAIQPYVWGNEGIKKVLIT